MIPYIQKLARGGHLSLDESQAAMREIMDGRATPAQIAAYLTALSIKGPTPDEIAGAALVMREGHPNRCRRPAGRRYLRDRRHGEETF